MENEYLNEEKYRKAEKMITLVAILVLLAGLSLGGFLIYRGVVKPDKARLLDVKTNLETKKKELEDKGIKYDTFAEYTSGEKYDLKIITKALDPSFNYCGFDEYKDNIITSEYCKVKNNTGDFASTSSIMIGVFVSIASLMISGFIFMVAKGRHILAFTMEQAMPVAKEGVSEMAPTMGKAATEFVKGVRKGMKDE